MQTSSDRYPNIEFYSFVKEESLSGKIYLGFFLAFCLFISVLFGNLLFSIIVVILSIFIMLSYESQVGRVVCKIEKDKIIFTNQEYLYKNIKSFALLENTLTADIWYLKLSFKNYIAPNVYIQIGKGVQKETIYAIMSARLEENPSKKLSLTEMLMLKIF